MTFRQEKYKQSTSLSNFVWELKNIPVQYKIDWSIIGKAATYHPSTRMLPLSVGKGFDFDVGSQISSQQEIWDTEQMPT